MFPVRDYKYIKNLICIKILVYEQEKENNHKINILSA